MASFPVIVPMRRLNWSAEHLPAAPSVWIRLRQAVARLLDFAGHCWQHIPDYSVFNIARLTETKKFELYKKNIINFIDIPDDYPLNENQWMQVKSELNNTSTIDKKKIKEFVSDLKYPLYFMDFETFATAIPVFDKSKPYQQLVFQYSLHILPSTIGTPKTATANQAVYNITSTNVSVALTNANNGRTATANWLVNIANIEPTVTITKPSGRYQTGKGYTAVTSPIGSEYAAAPSYTITIISNQQLLKRVRIPL